MEPPEFLNANITWFCEEKAESAVTTFPPLICHWKYGLAGGLFGSGSSGSGSSFLQETIKSAPARQRLVIFRQKLRRIMIQSYSKSGASVLNVCSLLLALWIVACSPRPATVNKDEAPASSGPQKVSGFITQTSSYCGGARPTEEVLEEYNRPKPYSGKTLFVIGGEKNGSGNKVIAKLSSNDTGYFSLSLSPGVYSIVQEEQMKPLDTRSYNSAKMVEADTTCLRKWWSEPLAVIRVSNKEVKGISINFHHPCFVSGDVPCLRYVGPMPP